ncbi:hypothetical protein P4S72_29565 [Vibrio sp. PP-XX7]
MVLKSEVIAKWRATIALEQKSKDLALPFVVVEKPSGKVIRFDSRFVMQTRLISGLKLRLHLKLRRWSFSSVREDVSEEGHIFIHQRQGAARETPL